MRGRFVFVAAGVLLLAASFSISVCAEENLSPKQLVEKGQELFGQGFYRDAQSYCKRALRVDPKFYPAYNLLGFIAARKEGREAETISYFRKSLGIQPKQIDLYSYISSLYMQFDNTDKALFYVDRGLEYSPGNFQLNFNAGLIYLLLKQDPYKALTYFEKARETKPAYDRLLYLMGTAYLTTKKRALALEFVTQLRKLDNEFFASDLEAMIRRFDEGRTVDMMRVVQRYQGQPKKEGEKKTNVATGQTTTKVKGSGVLTVESRYASPESGSGVSAQVPPGMVRTRGSGTVQMQLQGKAGVETHTTLEPVNP